MQTSNYPFPARHTINKDDTVLNETDTVYDLAGETKTVPFETETRKQKQRND